MQKQVNSSMFKKNNKQNKWKEKKWIPLVIIIILALLALAINYAMLDILQAINNPT